jgi:proline iminopeptidase
VKQVTFLKVASLAVVLASVIAEAEVCRLRSAPTAGGTIAFRECGRGDPVLIVPGGPGLDADYIASLAQMIAGMKRRAILVEPRGTGASRVLLGDGAQLTVAGSVADVEAIRQAAGGNKITVIGHSFGGSVAQAYAAAHPDRIQALVLLDSAGPNTQKSQVPMDSWRKRATPEELTRYDNDRAKGDRISAMRLKFRLSFYHRDRGDAFVAALPDSSIHLDVMPLSIAYEHNFHVVGGERTPFPVVLVAGEMDWIRGYEPQLKAAYPKAQIMIIPEAGHFPWVDAPESSRTMLRRALAIR